MKILPSHTFSAFAAMMHEIPAHQLIDAHGVKHRQIRIFVLEPVGKVYGSAETLEATRPSSFIFFVTVRIDAIYVQFDESFENFGLQVTRMEAREIEVVQKACRYFFVEQAKFVVDGRVKGTDLVHISNRIICEVSWQNVVLEKKL